MTNALVRLTLNSRQAQQTNEALVVYEGLRNGHFDTLNSIADKLPGPDRDRIEQACEKLNDQYGDALSFEDSPDPVIVEGDNDLNEAEASFVTQALETYSRLLSGQVLPVRQLLRHRVTPDQFDNQQVQLLLRELKLGLTPDLVDEHKTEHVNYSIHADEISDDARVAYDVQQVLRQALAYYERPEGGIEVSFDAPMQYGDEPLPSISYEPADSEQAQKARQALNEKRV